MCPSHRVWALGGRGRRQGRGRLLLLEVDWSRSCSFPWTWQAGAGRPWGGRAQKEDWTLLSQRQPVNFFALMDCWCQILLYCLNKCFPIEKRNEKCRNLFSIEFDQLTFFWGIMEYHQETKLMIFVSYLLWWVCLSHDKKLPLISSMHLFNKLIYCNEWNTIFKFDLSKLNLTRSCDYFTIGHWENVYDSIDLSCSTITT